MDIVSIGISHKTAPVEVRERFFLRPVERELLLVHLKNEPAVAEAVVLSTCNRTEIYAHLTHDDPVFLFQCLFRTKNCPVDEHLFARFYVKRGRDAVNHLFQVASGLDSLVVGESQVLGQVKEAAALAHRIGMMGKIFHALTQTAVCCGKRVQTQTRLGHGGSSVSWAAVAMARILLGSLETKQVLIVGAGKMSRLTAGQLGRRVINSVFVMNRTLRKAEDLARQIGGRAVSFWDMKDILARVDICLCSAGAPHYLIEKDLVAEVMALRRQRPLLLIDISTPRNIDPQISSVAGVRLVSMDDLRKVVTDNIEQRRLAVGEALGIVGRKVNGFYEKIFVLTGKGLS
jgi:glutamyl-tRNA reductase